MNIPNEIIHRKHYLDAVQSNFLIKGINFVKYNYLDATNGVLSLMAFLGVATFIKRRESQLLANDSNYRIFILSYENSNRKPN